MNLRHACLRAVLAAGVLMLSLVLGVSSAQAQTTQATSTSQTFEVADVDLQNCTLSLENPNIVTIVCGIVNKMGIQPDIRYSVTLVNKSTGATEDQEGYTDSVSLNQDQMVTKTITYIAPPFLQGDFTVWVTLQTAEGLPLDSQPVGDISLGASSTNYILISPNSCFLSIAGDSTKYSVIQGIDFGENEAVTVTCSAQNLSATSTLIVTPSFETHLRTLVGDIVPTTSVTQMPISFSKKAQQTISFALPKALAPQAYDTLLTLQTADGTTASNSVRIHYVLDGASATIQQLSLDKDYYAVGDTAMVGLIWTGSADMFSGSRNSGTDDQAQTIQLSLVDGNGDSCAAPVSQPVSANGSAIPSTFNLSVTKACINPTLTASILDTSGNVLAKKSISLATSAVPAPAPATDKYGLWLSIIAVLVLLTLIGFGIKRHRDRRLLKAGILFVFLVLGVSAPHANAATFERVDGSGTDQRVIDFTADLDKDPPTAYAPSSPIAVSGIIDDAYCDNGANYRVNIDGTNSADGVDASLTGGFIYGAGNGGGSNSANLDTLNPSQPVSGHPVTLTAYIDSNVTDPNAQIDFYVVENNDPSNPTEVPGDPKPYQDASLVASQTSVVSTTFTLPSGLPAGSYGITATITGSAPQEPKYLGTIATFTLGEALGQGDYSSSVLMTPSSPGGYSIQLGNEYIDPDGGVEGNKQQPSQDTLPYLVAIPSIITASASAGGSINPSGSITVNSGANQSFTITPNSGYSISQVLVDGVNNASAVSSRSYTFTDVTTNHSISASFSLNTPEATLNASSLNYPVGSTPATLTWGCSNWTSCSSAGRTLFNPSGPPGSCSGGTASVGTLGAGDYQYKLACTNGGLTNYDSVTIIVQSQSQSNPTATITATPNPVQLDTTTNLSWNTSDVTSCDVTGPNVSLINLTGSQLNGSDPNVTVNGQSTYTITCSPSASGSVTVNVGPGFTEF